MPTDTKAESQRGQRHKLVCLRVMICIQPDIQNETRHMCVALLRQFRHSARAMMQVLSLNTDLQGVMVLPEVCLSSMDVATALS
jgi:hypothetical protein